MYRGSIRLGTIFGIEIRLDYSWFIIFFLITWSLRPTGAHDVSCMVYSRHTGLWV